MTCPGCISSAVGHDPDCPVMSEAVTRQCNRCVFGEEMFPLHGSQCPMRSEVHVARGASITITGEGAGESPSPMFLASQRIRERIGQKRALYSHYLAHSKRMLAEEDAHGAWDGSVCLSEVSNHIDGLQWALDVLEGRE
jgi:hypothetical protein